MFTSLLIRLAPEFRGGLAETDDHLSPAAGKHVLLAKRIGLKRLGNPCISRVEAVGRCFVVVTVHTARAIIWSPEITTSTLFLSDRRHQKQFA